MQLFYIILGNGDGSQPSQRRTRGPTVGAGTCDVVKKTQQNIPIMMDAQEKLVEGIETNALFVNEIGMMTRANAPLKVKGWKEVTLEDKKKMAGALKVTNLMFVEIMFLLN